ncbi:recombination regulator RecX [Mesobacillus zeae]|uniref:Regulatory protein RecX n=1 Tax=Mesobacillus zeae TaxID=1917180 RepID=A0A398B472_9BACI|nr:recombination regulator RecX [Mesobacillus zeae]RID84391.1 recombination regulator RecX [Mesobacillus zeae]
MPIIAKISVQKHNKERYSIFTDSGKGEEYAFSVDEDVLIKHGLKKGMELDDLSLTEILFHDDIRKTYNQAIQYLSHRMRSEKEVRAHLQKKEIAEPVINEAIHRLYQFDFLNDREFATAYLRTQVNTSDKGPSLIRQELKEKGIAGALIDETMAEYAIDAQIEKAIKIGSKFAVKNVRDSSRILKQKLEQLLLRKGYPFSIISIALEEVVVEKQDNAEMEALSYQGEKLRKKHSKLLGYEFRRKIKQGLYQKGFPIDLIDRYLDSIEDED